jgi:hypothetical protein
MYYRFQSEKKEFVEKTKFHKVLVKRPPDRRRHEIKIHRVTDFINYVKIKKQKN